MLSIRWNGKDSYKDFGATIKSYTHGFPKKNNYIVQVPYSSKPIDFTQLHKESYGTRELSYVFNLICSDINKMDQLITKFCNWIMAGNSFQSLFDISERYHFMAQCINCQPTTRHNTCELTVTFLAEPYRLSFDYSQAKWDTFSFETDYLNQTEFPAARGKVYTFYNYGTAPICPTIIYIPDGASSRCTINFDGAYNIEETSKFDDFIFQVGANQFTVTGKGTVKFSAIEEVL